MRVVSGVDVPVSVELGGVEVIEVLVIGEVVVVPVDVLVRDDDGVVNVLVPVIINA